MSRAIVVKNGATQAWRNLQMRWRIATLTLLLILILTLTQHNPRFHPSKINFVHCVAEYCTLIKLCHHDIVMLECTWFFRWMYRVRQNKICQHENCYISEMPEYFALNFAHLFATILCTNVLLCAVFTWHMSNWWKRKLRERISRLNKKLLLLLK